MAYIGLTALALIQFFSPAEIAGNTNLVGQYVETVGIVDCIEPDKLSSSTFLVVFLGDFRARILKENLIEGIHGLKEVKIRRNKEGKLSVWLKGNRIEKRVFAPGQCYIVRGVVKKELSKIIIEKVDIEGLKINL